MSSGSEWLSTEEAAKYIGLGLTKFREVVAKNELHPARPSEKKLLFSKSDLDAWMNSKKLTIETFFKSIEANIEDNSRLRDPQIEAYQAIRKYLLNPGNTRAMAVLPVGCGKSVLIAICPFGLAQGRVLVITPNLAIRNDLRDKLSSKIKSDNVYHKLKLLSDDAFSAGPYVALLDGDSANIHDCNESHIVLANIQQLGTNSQRWLPNFPDDFFDMIIIDEAHHSAADSWKFILEKFKNAKVVFLTATPFRSDNQSIPGEIIYRYTFTRAMQKGYVKQLKAAYVAPDELTFTYESDTRIHTLAEVLTLKEEEWFSRGVALSDECRKNIVSLSLKKLDEMRTTGTKHQLIASAMSIRDAKEIKAIYSSYGYKTEVIHSKMTTIEQENVLSALRNGMLDCIVQVQKLGEGFDHPKLSIAAIFRPFRSLSPYIQFVGRALRSIVQPPPGSPVFSHPDNVCWVVTHIGMNQDKHFDDFKDLEKDDATLLKKLLEASESDSCTKTDSISGTREVDPFRKENSLRVTNEIVTSFLQESFLSAEDKALRDSIIQTLGALGITASEEQVQEILKKQSSQGKTTQAFDPSLRKDPQTERQALRTYLFEKVKSTASAITVNVGIQIKGRDLSKIEDNFAVLVKQIWNEIHSLLNTDSGDIGSTSKEQLQLALEKLPVFYEKILSETKKRVNKT